MKIFNVNSLLIELFGFHRLEIEAFKFECEIPINYVYKIQHFLGNDDLKFRQVSYNRLVFDTIFSYETS